MSEWERHGECSHCGWCCAFLALVEVKMTSTDEPFMDVRGFQKSGESYVGKVGLYSPCPKHIENRCSIYESRPKTCQDFPSEPQQIMETPCSYWFERTLGDNIERVGGGGSPYPQS